MMRYIKDFCEKHFYWEDIDTFGQIENYYSSIPEKFSEHYESILADLPKNFNSKEYEKFDTLQECINILELDKEAFWGFIVFLYHSANCYFKEKWCGYGEKIKETNQFIENSITKGLKVSFTSGRKKLEITDPVVLKGLFAIFQLPENYWQNIEVIQPTGLNGQYQTVTLKEYSPAWIETEEATARKKSYFVIKLLLLHLFPNSGKGLNYPQNISVLCLCVLHLCGFLWGERQDVCHKSNIITLRKLLTDFRNTNIDIANIDATFNWKNPLNPL